ncbi:MAG: zf-HC2 domain-containing protein [Woeseiaceae bacterium]|nr:zf-HC2 domain-containing protein [Woeseiaceae bacterium]
MITVDDNRQHDGIREILPWYVNGTLTPEEHGDVERHLENCNECRQDIRVLQQMRTAVLHADATPIVPAPSPGKLLDKVGRAGARRRRIHRGAMLGGVAAVLAVAFLAGMLLSGNTPRVEEPARYRTLTSGSQSGALDYVLEVTFESGLADADRDRILDDLGAANVQYTPRDNVYRVAISAPRGSLRELEQLTGRMASLPEIRAVDVVAVQLPVQDRE